MYFTSEISGQAPPDWWQTSGKGLDAGASHGDDLWLINENAQALRWDTGSENWQPFGGRGNFKRIDAARNGGAAALNKRGRLFVTDGQRSWVPTGIRARDVGIGGGFIWLAGVRLQDGSRATLKAPFAAQRDLEWEVFPGDLRRIDVDPKGRAWGLDKKGTLYAHTGENWVQVPDTPAARDVAVGGLGSVFLVARKIDENLGGGEIYQRGPTSSEWQKITGRLKTITASGNDRVFGVNTQQSFLVAGGSFDRKISPEKPVIPELGGPGPIPEQPENNEEPPTGSLLLAEFAGDGAFIPEKINDALVSEIKEQDGYRLGVMTLNGQKTKVLKYTPQESENPNLLLGYDAFSFSSFAPDFRGTALDDLDTFENVVIALVPDGNEEKRPDAKLGTELNKVFDNSEISGAEFASGINFYGTSDLSNLDDGPAVTALLGMEDTKISISQVLKESLFANVSPSDTVPEPFFPDIQRTPENVAEKYGSDFFDNLVIGAPIDLAENLRWGLAIVRKLSWEVRLGDASEIELTADLDFPIEGAVTLQTKAAQVTYQHEANNLEILGTVTREGAQNLVELPGLTLDTANLAGNYSLPDGDKEASEGEDTATPPRTGIWVAGLSTLKSQARGDRELSYEISLIENEEGDAFEPSLLFSGGIMLTDITNGVVPAILDQVELTQIEINNDIIAGSMTMDGRPVRVARYTGDKVDEPLVLFLHEDVNLASYIPEINSTVLGGFSLGTTALFATEGMSEPLSFETVEDLPEIISEFLDTNQPGMFPLEVKNGLSMVGFYDAAKVSEEEAAAFEDLEIPKQGYVAKGHFDIAVLGNMDAGASDETTEIDPDTKTENAQSRRLDFDVQFNISGFKVPRTEGYLSFNGSVFNLSRAEETIEVSIATGIELAMKEDSRVNLGGVQTLAMAGKMALEKDGNDALKISMAASTALNIDDATSVSFANLSTLDQDEGEASEENTTDGSEEETSETENGDNDQPVLGWQNAFGINELTVFEVALATTFEATGNEANQTFSISSDATFGTEPVSFTGMVTFEIDGAANNAEVAEASLLIPGPIALGGLPYVKDVPKADEFIVSDIQLTQDSFYGEFDWPPQMTAQDSSPFGRFYVGREANLEDEEDGDAPEAGDAEAEPSDDLIFMARVERLSGQMLKSDIPAPLGEMEMGPAYFAWRDGEPRVIEQDDLSESLSSYFEDLVPEDKPIAFPKGLMVGGLVAPDATGNPLVTEMAAQLSITDPLMFSGLIAPGEGDQRTLMEVSAGINDFQVPQIPESIIDFGATQIVVSNLEEDSVILSSEVTLKPPQTNLELSLVGDMEYVRDGDTRNLIYCFAPSALNACEEAIDGNAANAGQFANAEPVTVDPTIDTSSGETPSATWDQPFGIQGTKIGNVAFRGDIEFKDGGHSQDCQFEGEASFGTATAKGVIEACHGIDNPNVSTSDPSFKSIVQMAEDAYIYIEEQIALSDLPNIPPEIINRLDGSIANILVARNATSGAVTATLGGTEGLQLSGRGGIVGDSSNFMFMVKSEQAVELDPLIPSNLAPLDQLEIPSGVVIISTQDQAAFELDYLPDVIFNDMFEGLIKPDTGAKLRVEDGLTFVTRANLGFFPTLTQDILSTTFGIGNDVVIGGGIGGLFQGVDKSVAVYTSTKGFTLPDLPGGMFTVNNADAQVFVSKEFIAGATGPLTVGVSTDAILKMPRLDAPGTLSGPLETTLQLDFVFGETTTPSLNLSATVNGQWVNPMGFEDLTLTNTTVGVGTQPGGLTIQVSTNEAQFKGSTFFFDLDSAWAGGVPTQLATQFGRPRQEDGSFGPDLIVSPDIQMQLANNLFMLALRGSNNLAENVIARLPNDPVATPALNFLREQMTSGGARASDAMMALLENSPLTMIALRNPEIYFVTPGNSLPAKSAYRPPLGLGLHAEGQLILDMLGLEKTLAQGVFKVNLLDGFFIEGEANAGSPFQGNDFKISGNQPIIPIAGGQKLSVDGSITIPGLNLIDGIPALGEGNFEFERVMNTAAPPVPGIAISGNAKILGFPAPRPISAQISTASAWMEAPSGGCFDVPIRVKAEMRFPTDGTDPWEIVTPSAFRVFEDLPNPIECASELFEKLAEAGKAAAWAAEKGFEVGKQGFQTMVGLGQGVIGLAGPVGAPISAAINEVGNLSRNSINAMKSGDPSALAGAIAGSLNNLTSGLISGLGSLFGSDDEPPRYFNVSMQRCLENQYWNPILGYCMERDAMVIMHTGHDDGANICMNNPLNTDGFVAAPCDGTDRTHFVFNDKSQTIKTVRDSWFGFQARWIGADSHERCAEAYLDNNGLPALRLNDTCSNDAAQKWTYTGDGNFVTTALGNPLCIAVPERQGPDTGQLILVDCNDPRAQSKNAKLKWTATSLFPDYARKYRHAYEGKLTNAGKCLNSRGVMKPSLSDVEFKSCENWRINYTEDGLMQLVEEWNLNGYAVCVGWNELDANDFNYSIKFCNRTDSTLEAHWAPPGSFDFRFDPNDAGAAFREPDANIIFKDPKFGRCLTREGDFARAMKPCDNIVSGNIFRFTPVGENQASLLADARADEEAQKRLRDNLRINSGDQNGIFTGVRFIEQNRCIGGSREDGPLAEAMQGDEDCLRFISIQEAEIGSTNIKRVALNRTGTVCLAAIEGSSDAALERCVYGRKEQLWLQHTTPTGAFALANMVSENCLSTEGSGRFTPLSLETCGASNQLMQLAQKMNEERVHAALPTVDSIQRRELLLAEIDKGHAAQFAGQLRFVRDNSCAAGIPDQFFSTTGEMRLTTLDCIDPLWRELERTDENPPTGVVEADTAIGLYPTSEFTSAASPENFRLRMDATGLCVSLPIVKLIGGGSYIDVPGNLEDLTSIPLLPRTCRTGSPGQVWEKEAIGNGDTFRLRGTGIAADFCLGAAGQGIGRAMLATRCEGSVQALALDGPWKQRETDELALATNIAPTLATRPGTVDEYVEVAEVIQFTPEYAVYDRQQTVGFGQVQLFNTGSRRDGNLKSHCMTSGQFEENNVPLENQDGRFVRVRSNLGIKVCDPSNRKQYAAFLQAETGQQNAGRLYFRDEDACLTKARPNTGGTLRLEKCDYGSAEQIITLTRDSFVNPETGNGMLYATNNIQNGLLFFVRNQDPDRHGSMTPDFINREGPSPVPVTMTAKPTISGTSLTSQADFDRIQVGHSKTDAVQIRLVENGATQQCLEVRNNERPELRVGATGCGDANAGLETSKAFRYYEAEVPGTYRIRSQATNQCLMVPVKNTADGSVELAWQVEDQVEVDRFCNWRYPSEYVRWEDIPNVLRFGLNNGQSVRQVDLCTNPNLRPPVLLGTCRADSPNQLWANPARESGSIIRSNLKDAGGNDYCLEIQYDVDQSGNRSNHLLVARCTNDSLKLELARPQVERSVSELTLEAPLQLFGNVQ